MDKIRLVIFIILGTTCSLAFAQVPEEIDPIQYEGDILDTALTGYAPGIDYAAELNLRGMASLGERLPFWMYHNQRGRVFENSNYSGWLTGKAISYFKQGMFVEAGAGLLNQDGPDRSILPDELYIHFQTSWLRLTAGSKQRPAKYNGLSASSENILWSVNARPLPGVQLSTNGPVFISGRNGLGFEASWNEYRLGKDRHLEDARLHHKSFHLVYQTRSDIQIKAGFQHFAHWAGRNPETSEERPKAFRDYLEAVRLKHPSQNHLSSYEIYLSKSFRDFRLEILYNHIAEDRTGRRLGNTPDGRYGIFYEAYEGEQLITSAIYEFYYTHHQSHTSTSGNIDDYFNHYAYRSGWAYKDHVIGAPFFTYDAGTQRVINNKFTAHHLGIGGRLPLFYNSFPYEFLMSYSLNEGTYERPFSPQREVFSTFLDLRVLESPVILNVHLATEISNYTSPIYGAALHLKYRL